MGWWKDLAYDIFCSDEQGSLKDAMRNRGSVSAEEMARLLENAGHPTDTEADKRALWHLARRHGKD